MCADCPLLSIDDPSENINLLKDGSGSVDCGPMQQILKRSTNDSDDQTKLAAARALALVLSTSHNTQDVQQFLGWAVQQLSAGQSSTTTAVAALTIMLRSRPARIAFAQQDGIAL